MKYFNEESSILIVVKDINILLISTYSVILQLSMNAYVYIGIMDVTSQIAVPYVPRRNVEKEKIGVLNDLSQ